MLPQRAIFEKASEGDFAKMSKPVQVCTACQFVKGQNIALIHFCYVKITLSHLWPIRPQAEILFLLFVLLPNLGKSDFEKSFDPTCFQFGNK